MCEHPPRWSEKIKLISDSGEMLTGSPEVDLVMIMNAK
jgi:hypothetical protein